MKQHMFITRIAVYSEIYVSYYILSETALRDKDIIVLIRECNAYLLTYTPSTVSNAESKANYVRLCL